MKAAVIHNFGETLRYEDFADPVPGKDETLVQVKAVVLENFDKMAANGTHYSSRKMFPQFPAIVGHGGIGTTPDGKLAAFGMMKAPYGALAEKAAVKFVVPVPEGIDAAIAAALPASILTSFLPLKYTAKLEPGETVLINGATGVSGKIAIQVAKMLGAGRVVGTGRNEASLKLLKSLGADAVIDLKQTDENLLATFEKEAGEEGYNVVIDFLWGHPAEILMKSFVPKEAGFAKRRIRYMHIGEKAGAGSTVTGEMLRTSGLEIYGTGNIPPETLPESIKLVWGWIKENRFHIDIEKVPLADIEKAWLRNDLEGKRIVIIP
jgi:NADPH:quinone reductase-like Zn-dependent oxidoreductase